MTSIQSRVWVWLALAAFSLQLVVIRPLHAQQTPAPQAPQPPAAASEAEGDGAPSAPAETAAETTHKPSAAPVAPTEQTAAPAENTQENAAPAQAPAPAPAAQTETDKWKKADPAADVRLKKQEKKSTHSGSVVDGLIGDRPAPDRDRFELDYAPTASTKNEKEKTPWYQHWAFWTAVGVLVCGGVVLGVTLGNKSSGSDTLSIGVTRRK